MLKHFMNKGNLNFFFFKISQENHESQRIQLTFSLKENRTAPKAGNSFTSGLKINLKTPVNPIFFTYINKLPGKRKNRMIRNNLKYILTYTVINEATNRLSCTIQLVVL